MQNLTVYVDEYNWPQYPSIEVGSDGVVHAFWYQEFHDDCMTFSGEAVYYRTRDGGTWVDNSLTLNGHVGKYTQTRLDRFGRANFVMSEKVDGVEDILFAGYVPTASVQDVVAESDHPLTVCPNPFRSSTTLSFEAGSSGRVECSIFDAGGRLVWQSGEDAMIARRHVFIWDGRDRSGRPLPSGTYRACVVASGRAGNPGRAGPVSASCGMTLLR
jgi:hypothetical protein